MTSTQQEHQREAKTPNGGFRSDDWKQCDFVISMMGGGGYGHCSRALGHPDPHTLHSLPPEKIGGTGAGEYTSVEGARWMKRCFLDIGWVMFERLYVVDGERRSLVERHCIGAQNGFVILEDADGNQVNFREWEFCDIMDGVERLGQLPQPRFSEDGARARLRALRPELDEDAIEAVIFAVRTGGACGRPHNARDMSMRLKTSLGKTLR